MTRQEVINRWNRLGLGLLEPTPYWDAPLKPKGQIISDIDPYGEEDWDDDVSPLRGCTEQLLPLSMKVASQTIGLDIVAVIPRSDPVIQLGYFDFRYDNKYNELKGQIISDIDPYGEENWED